MFPRSLVHRLRKNVVPPAAAPAFATNTRCPVLPGPHRSPLAFRTPASPHGTLQNHVRARMPGCNSELPVAPTIRFETLGLYRLGNSVLSVRIRFQVNASAVARRRRRDGAARRGTNFSRRKNATQTVPRLPSFHKDFFASSTNTVPLPLKKTDNIAIQPGANQEKEKISEVIDRVAYTGGDCRPT